MRLPPEGAPRSKGERHRTSVERLQRFITTRTDGQFPWQTADLLRHLDVMAAVESPDAPLEEWDKSLTSTIRALSSLRRAIRDAQRA